VSILPQAPEAAGVAEYIVLAEAIAQAGIDPTGPAEQHIPVALATESSPLSVATRVPPIATAVSATSSDSTRLPIQWGVGMPLRSATNRSSSSRPSVPDPAAQAGGPHNLDEYVNRPLFQRVASPRTNGSSVSVLPQAPEEEVEVVTLAFTITTAGTSSSSKGTPVRYGAGTPMPGRMAIERRPKLELVWAVAVH
jgi:hypothetical protein